MRRDQIEELLLAVAVIAFTIAVCVWLFRHSIETDLVLRELYP